jgi:hypothetical protein
MTAHQPNLFAYSGVFRKATLNHLLAKRLSELLDIPVVSFFGFADQDFTDDRWVRSALIPDLERRHGVIELRIPLPQKIMLNKSQKPSDAILNRWKQDVQDWIHRKAKSVAQLAGVTLDENEYSENFRQLWSITTDSHDRAANCADFNAFIISKIVNDTWGYDTLFCRFSECQQIFKREFSSLIDRFWEYSDAVREAEERSRTEDGGVHGDEHLTIPVWYHCACRSKARLIAADAQQGIIGHGDCLVCGKQYEIDFSRESAIWSDFSRVSARALAMPLVFFGGLGVSCYVGGVGGRQYLRQAKYVADQMRTVYPPVVIWRPHDRYLGLAQLETLLTLKQLVGSPRPSQCKEAEVALKEKLATIQRRIDELELCKKNIAGSVDQQDRKIQKIKALAEQQNTMRRETDFAMLTRHLGLLENSQRVMTLYPCIVDYAINVGLKNVCGEWEGFLNTVGDLSADITIRTKIDQQLSSLGLQSSWPTVVEDLRDDRVS